MEHIKIPKTKSTPEITLNSSNGKCKIAGSSYPENTREFYDPIFKWLNEYMLEICGDVTFDFNINYLNSSSIKSVSDLVEKLNNYSRTGVSVEINWYYSEDDEDIEELGKEFLEEAICKFNLIQE